MYKRILLKLSGEALSNSTDVFDLETLQNLSKTIKKVSELGIEICIVVGGGNIIRGKYAQRLNMPREKADTMGMLGTVINALGLQASLENEGVKAYVQTAIEVPMAADNINVAKANKMISEGYVIVFGGGVGKPYYSTDTGAALRALEMKCDSILIAKNNVDGVYDDDPSKNPNAKKIDRMTFKEIVDLKLEVIDTTAAQMCADNNIDAVVFNMNNLENIVKVAKGENIGTVITGGK